MTDTTAHFGAACCSYKSVDFDDGWQRLKRVMKLEFIGRNKTWSNGGRTQGTFVYMANNLVVEFHNDPTSWQVVSDHDTEQQAIAAADKMEAFES